MILLPAALPGLFEGDNIGEMIMEVYDFNQIKNIEDADFLQFLNIRQCLQ